MGGTDDPENLIELTVEDHAEEHRKLFEKYGRWQDYIAWQGLARLISKEDLVKRIQIEAGKSRIRKHGNPFSGIKTSSNISINEKLKQRLSFLANTPEAIEKKKKTMAERNHQRGEKNSQFGTKWCIKENAVDISGRKKFREIPNGWITITEWKNRRKNKTNNAYGRHWYNDGIKNFFLKESDPMTKQLIIGRIMAVNRD